MGILVIEFLLKYFNTMFEYDYTKNMEDDLDKIALGKKIWYTLCELCYNEMITLMKEIKENKIEFKIDKYHTYTIAKYGPVIKYKKGDETSFKSVRKDLDMEKLKNGEYKLKDILLQEKTNNVLGTYENKPVYLKKGKFGYYINHDKKNVSIKNLLKEKNENKITLEDVLPYLKNEVKNTNVLKKLNDDISIRTGKYGPYVFYKTKTMKKPKFINLKGENWKSIDVEWVNNQV